MTDEQTMHLRQAVPPRSVMGLDRSATIFLLAVSAGLVALGFISSGGLFTVDEFIYLIGADAFLKTGGFVVENGYDEIGAEELRLLFLIDGRSGLVPQYPPGASVAGAPLIAIFGDKGLFVLNIAAAIGTLFVTHSLAQRLFASDRVALLAAAILAFCTFWIEYAPAHWPHSVSIFFTALALRFFIDAMDDEAAPWRAAVFSGLAVGTGLLFRLDGLLLLPGLAVATILFARRPLPVVAGGAVGILPSLGLMSWANWVKLGTLSPLSYGGASGGFTDPTSYFGLAGVMLLGMLVLAGLRVFGHRLAALRRGVPAIAAVAAIAVALMIALVLLWPWISRLALGTYRLLVDATAIVDPRPGVVAMPDGTQSFWGLPKKALGQSLPWLGSLALLVGAFPTDRRRNTSLLLMICALWMLPFLMLSWHGGLGSNMRYFLPLVPFLCVLTAFLIVRLADQAGSGRRTLGLGLGFAAGALLSVLWLMLLADDRSTQLHQIVSTYSLLGIVAVCLVAGFVRRAESALAALLAIGWGLGMAMILGVEDLANGQYRRAILGYISDAARSIEGPVVLVGAPEAFASAIGNPDQVVSISDFDAAFTDRVCAAGYRLVALSVTVEDLPDWQSLPVEAHGIPFAEYDCAAARGE